MMIRSRLTYIALLIAAFIFSQALYDSISLFTLAVVILLPLVSLLCLLISLSLVKIQVVPFPNRVYRMEQTSIKVWVISKTPLMLPMMKFRFITSNEEGDRAIKGHTVVHYRAFGKTLLEIPIRYNVRGMFQIGVDSVEFYDFLRLFRIRRKIAEDGMLTVYPRNLQMELTLEPSRQEQENTITSGGRETKNNGDIAGIREFNEYDTLRQVHWKLSARLSKMIVKTYWENTCDNIMVLADLFPYEPDRLLNRKLTDSVVEIALKITALLAERKVRVALGCPMYNSVLNVFRFASTDGQMKAADTFAMVPMMDTGSLEQTLHEMDFTSLQGGALYVISSMPPKELEKCLRPYLRGLNCDLQCLVVRPEAEEPYGDDMKILPLEEMERGVRI